LPPLPFSRNRRAVSEYFSVLVLIAATLGLSAFLYQAYSSSFRFAAPPPFSFGFRAVDTGSGFEQVTVEFQFQGLVEFSDLLLNGTSNGYLSLGADGSYAPARGGVEFFSFVLPLSGQLTISNVSFALVDGEVASSIYASAGRHAAIVVAGGNYTISAPSFDASRQSGVDPAPFMSPENLSKPASSFTLLLPMKSGSTLTVTLVYSNGLAEGVVDA